MKKITSFLLFAINLFLCTHESQSNSFCTTNTSQTISPDELWREGVEEFNKEKLEQSLMAGFKLSDREISRFVEKITENNQRNLIEWLLTQPHGIPMLNQFHVDKIFQSAANKNHHKLMEWLLMQSHDGIPLPSQGAVNIAFNSATHGNHRDLMEWLLTQPHGITLPDEHAVNLAFSSSASNNHRDLMEWLLTRPYGIPLSNQEGVNKAFSSAAHNNHRDIMEWLLTRPHGIPLPDKGGVTRAFNNAERQQNYALMKWILTQQERIPLPEQDNIVKLYRQLCSRRYLTSELGSVLRRMDLLVPEQERINQGRRIPVEALQNEPRQIIPNRAMASEVHDYANTNVPISSHSASASATGTTDKLFDVVVQNIEKRIEQFIMVTTDIVHDRLMSAIETVYAGDSEHRALANHALNNSYVYENASLYLQKVITFLDHLPEPQLKFDLWFKGFIEESIEAYKNSQNKLSCTKGIEERILTGLRSVDKELDQIFKHAEALLLMKNYIKKQFNV